MVSAEMLDRKSEMSYVTSHIADTFPTDLFVIRSEDNSKKLIIQCRSLMPKNKEIQIEEDQFLRQIGNTMLNNITLRGVEGNSPHLYDETTKFFVRCLHLTCY